MPYADAHGRCSEVLPGVLRADGLAHVCTLSDLLYHSYRSGKRLAVMPFTHSSDILDRVVLTGKPALEGLRK